MILEFTLPIIALLVLIIASYNDIKTREVPDWLNYALIFSALGIRAIFSITLGWEIIVSGILGFLIFFTLACLFYYTNQWGGGDAKLLMGMGAIIGLTFPLNQDSWNLFWYFLSLLFMGAIFGLLWMIILAIRKRKIFLKEFKTNLLNYKSIHLILWGVSLFFLITAIFNHFFFPFVIFPIGFFYLFSFVEVVEKSFFLKRISINKLTEGDWLAEDVKINHEKVMAKKTLEYKDLLKLHQLKQNKQLNSVLIKEGIPFVPSFLLGYLFLLFGKSIFIWLIQLLI